MSVIASEVLAERVARVRRHLDRVRDRLPARAEDLHPESDQSDALVAARVRTHIFGSIRRYCLYASGS